MHIGHNVLEVSFQLCKSAAVGNFPVIIFILNLSCLYLVASRKALSVYLTSCNVDVASS